MSAEDNEELLHILAGGPLTEVSGEPIVAMRSGAGGLIHMASIAGSLVSWSLPTNRRAQRVSLLDRKLDGKHAALTCMDVADAIQTGGVPVVAIGQSTGRVAMVDIKSGDRLRTFDDHTLKVSNIALPAFSNQLYTTAFDGVFQVRNLEADAVQHQFCACRCPLTTLQTISNSPHEVIIGGVDGHIRYLDLRAKQSVNEWVVNPDAEEAVRCMTVDPEDSHHIYLAYGNGHLQAWDRRSLGAPRWQSRNVHADAINVLAFDNSFTSSASSLMASSSSASSIGAADANDDDDGGSSASAASSSSPSRDQLLDTKSAKLYTGGDDGRLHVVSAHDGKRTQTLSGIHAAVNAMLMSDGELFVGGMDSSIRRYDIEGLGRILDEIRLHQEELAKQEAAERARLAEEAKRAEEEKAAKKKGGKGGKEEKKKKK